MHLDNGWNPKYSLEAVKTQLEVDGLPYEMVGTFLEQNQERYKRGKKRQFEESLCDKGIEYFAYIKFFESERDNYNADSLFAIVAGKSGSMKVNAYGSDVRFMNYPKPGEAKKWLYDNKKRWYHPHIIVIKTKDKDEAYKVERLLIEKFGLLES
ncbi:MAG: hypothetical protein IJ695_08900 [Butyrivibrio sp.]|nr:hypothetical protein [Butyrivibrio sp.]